MPMRYAKRVGISVVLIVLAMGFIVPYLVPWTPLNCQTQYVDIGSGRIRHSSYFCFVKVSDGVTDSPISLILKGDPLTKRKPDWHPVNTFSPGVRHSPHHRFHGAFNQIQVLDFLWGEGRFDLAAKQATARHILALWQFDGSYHLAERYLDSLGEMVNGGISNQALQSLKDLALPQVQQEGDWVVITLPYADGKPMERMQGYYGKDGEFVRHGTHEKWNTTGHRQLYDHFVNDSLLGWRYEWDSDGKLSAISRFSPSLVDYEYSNLERHPAFAYAKKLAENPLVRIP